MSGWKRLGNVGVLALAIVLAGCSKPAPPQGRWEGSFESADAMIVARLEIIPSGMVRISAPDAFTDISAMSDTDKAALHERLMSGLDAAWPSVAPIALDFDGKTFRKPGGVAPQMEWDGTNMVLIVYPGLHATIRMPLQKVDNFTP